MHFRKLGILTAIIFTVAITGSVLAQGQGRLYNPSTETTLQGSVTSVNTVTGRRGGWNGVHLTVQASDKKYDVHLGPAAFVANSGFTFSEGDQVEVVGSKVEFNGATSLIARQITKDGKVLALRDKQGFPLWSRGRRMAP